MNIIPDGKPIYSFDYQLRSRYSETDQMGYVYHGRFLEYFEEARTAMIRATGVTYAEMEERGVMLPVANVALRYKGPVKYDELITIRILLFEEPSTRFKTYYQVFVENDDRVKIEAFVELVFVDVNSRRPTKVPEYILLHMNEAINLA